MTLPVYTLPSGLAYIYAGSVFGLDCVGFRTSSRPEVWSSAVASFMDTEDNPLIKTRLPGCPYRYRSYSGQAFSDLNPAFGLQLHRPRFLEFVGLPNAYNVVCIKLRQTMHLYIYMWSP